MYFQLYVPYSSELFIFIYFYGAFCDHICFLHNFMFLFHIILSHYLNILCSNTIHCSSNIFLLFFLHEQCSCSLYFYFSKIILKKHYPYLSEFFVYAQKSKQREHKQLSDNTKSALQLLAVNQYLTWTFFTRWICNM